MSKKLKTWPDNMKKVDILQAYGGIDTISIGELLDKGRSLGLNEQSILQASISSQCDYNNSDLVCFVYVPLTQEEKDDLLEKYNAKIDLENSRKTKDKLKRAKAALKGLSKKDAEALIKELNG